MKRKCGVIYSIKNKVNNKRYIGQSVNVNLRWIDHKSLLKNDKHYNNYLQRSWNKHGRENFVFTIIENNIPIEELNKKEIYYINYFDTYKGDGYNLTPGGDNVKGINNPRSKINLQISERIINDRLYGMKYKDIANKYKVGITAIGEICNGNHWTTENLEKEVIKEMKDSYLEKLREQNKTKKKKSKKHKKNNVETTNQKRCFLKISNKIGRKIYERYKNENVSQSQLAKEYGVEQSTISKVVRCEHLSTKEINIPIKRDDYARGLNNGNSKVTFKISKKILEDRKQNKISCYALSEKYNINSNTILQIINGDHWTTCDIPKNKLPDIEVPNEQKEDNHPYSKINIEESVAILEKRKKERNTVYELADEFNVSTTTILAILNGEHWTLKYIDKKYDFNQLSQRIIIGKQNHYQAKINKNLAIQIIQKWLDDKLTYKDLENEFDLGQEVIGNIINGKHWICEQLNYDFEKHRNINKNSGELNSQSKINKEKAEKILKLKIKSLSYKEIAKKFQVCTQTIRSICKGEHWTVKNNQSYNFKEIYSKKSVAGCNNPRAKVTKELSKQILGLKKDGFNYSEISRKVGINNNTIGQICKGKHWTTKVNKQGEVIVDE